MAFFTGNVEALMNTSELLPFLPKVAEGKVRDVYEIDKDTLLFVATDRLSAFDVVLENGIPGKGCLLTVLSSHWMHILKKGIPSLRTHFITHDLPAAIPTHLHQTMKDRSMVVRKLKVFPIEAIVRGYLAGSAWTEYCARGTVHGILIAPDLEEAQAFPQGPIYTPSTKAAPGQHDMNIHPDAVISIVGAINAQRIQELALQLYVEAQNYAWDKGIIIADTKFEFGLDEDTDEIVLVDEVLTPDSSRFWSLASYKQGQSQDSFDKQYVRDWLVREGLQGKEGVSMPQEVVTATQYKYMEAYDLLANGGSARGL